MFSSQNHQGSSYSLFSPVFPFKQKLFCRSVFSQVVRCSSLRLSLRCRVAMDWPCRSNSNWWQKTQKSLLLYFSNHSYQMVVSSSSIYIHQGIGKTFRDQLGLSNKKARGSVERCMLVFKPIIIKKENWQLKRAGSQGSGWIGTYCCLLY